MLPMWRSKISYTECDIRFNCIIYSENTYLTNLTYEVPLKVFYADKKPLITRHIFSPVDWIQIKVSSFILKCHLRQQGEWQQNHEWLSRETSSKVVSIMKGVFNNEEAIGSLAVARQLHQDYSENPYQHSFTCQRARHARVF